MKIKITTKNNKSSKDIEAKIYFKKLSKHLREAVLEVKFGHKKKPNTMKLEDLYYELVYQAAVYGDTSCIIRKINGEKV